MNRRIKVHTCHAEPKLVKVFERGHRYYFDDDDRSLSYFMALPVKCSCKKTMLAKKIAALFDEEKLCRVYRARRLKRPNSDGRELAFVRSRKEVAIPLDRVQTPRVDLITKADIERAYVDGRKKSIRMIEETHLMIMTERAKLIVPFRPDPQEGRLLFPFGPDQRTSGGRS